MTFMDVLFAIFIKPLYYFTRAEVQVQVGMVILTVLLAWFVSKRLSKLFDNWLPLPTASTEADEEILTLEGSEQLAEVQPEPEVEERTRFQRWQHYLRLAMPTLIFPAVSLLGLNLASVVLVAQGNLVGLVSEATRFLWLLFSYRLIVGLLYARFDYETIRNEQQRFLTPVFSLYITAQLLRWIINLEMVSQIVVIQLFGSPVTWSALFLATVGFYLWLQFVRLIQSVLANLIVRSTQADSGTVEASLTLMGYILIGLGLLYIFSELRLDTTTVAALTGGISAGLAFGSKDIINNFISGILLLFERSIRPGDIVEFGGTMGIIRSLNIRSTTMQAFDGREIIIPNERILTSSFTTYTKSNRQSRIQLHVRVSYQTDLEALQPMLYEAVGQHENVLNDPEPMVLITEFAPSTVNILVFAWVDDISVKLMTTHDLHLIVWKTFRHHDIEIPYPKQDVYLRAVSAADESAPDLANQPASESGVLLDPVNLAH